MATIYHTPKNTLPRIDRIWAVISVDKDGKEGLCGAMIGDTTIALVSTDESRLPFLHEQAAILARETTRTIKIIAMTRRGDLATYGGIQG